MARETKSPRPLCRKQEFYYASSLRGISSQSPDPDQCQEIGYIPPRRVIQPGGFCQLQENKLVTGFATPHPLIECGYSYRKPFRASWGLQYCRASRKLLADSVWGNQGKFQKNGQDGSNIPPFDALVFYLSKCIISFILRDGVYSLVTL
jgi:hypothetical protein